MITRMKPFIKCIDYWPGEIPPDRLGVYKQLHAEEQIRIHQLIVNQDTGSTVIEYYAIAPHEWMLEQMAERVKDKGGNYGQIKTGL